MVDGINRQLPALAPGDDSLAREVDTVLAHGHRWLHFPARLEARFLDDTHAGRRRHYAAMVVLAIAAFDLFLVGDYQLIPDIFWLSVRMRLGVLTPLAIAVVLALRYLPSRRMHEVLVAFSCVGTCETLVLLMVETSSPLSSHYYMGVLLPLIFQNTVQRIRFWYAAGASLVMLLFIALGMSQLLQLTTDVRQTFVLITFATCVFTLLALYRLEYEERSNYLFTLKMEWQRQAVERQRLEAEHQKARLDDAQQQLIHQETMASLGRLVAGVAHEVSTPLGNIRMSATFMRQRLDDFATDLRGGRLARSEVHAWLQEMLQAAEVLDLASQRAAQQISGFKQLAVDQSSGLSCHFDLASTIEVVIKSMSHYLRKAEIAVTTSIDPGLELNGEPGRLEQAIVNLITNAVIHGFDEHGPGGIAIKARREGDHIEMLFSDNGRGMPLSVQTKIFEPFFTTRFGQGGSGLGLYIVHNIVTHGFNGKLRVESEPGRGTTFILLLPAAALA